MTNTTLTKFSTESDTFYLDCTDVLFGTDTITGTPTLSYLPSGLSGADELTFSAISVNTEEVTFPNGRIGKIGGVVVVRIAGGTASSATLERTYTVIATFTTVAGNTKTVRGRLLLLPLGY